MGFPYHPYATSAHFGAPNLKSIPVRGTTARFRPLSESTLPAFCHRDFKEKRRHGLSVTDIYRSSNGDCWRLILYPDTGHSLVRHEPNLASGGRTTDTDVDEFLSVDGPGPEYPALRRLLENAAETSHSGDE